MVQTVPNDIQKKYDIWRLYATWWHGIHFVTGFTSASLTVIIAANARGQFLSVFHATIIASVAAGLAFLVTAMGAQTRAKGFELAAREVESAIVAYRHDDTNSEKSLSDAVNRGLHILNSMK